MSYNRTVHCSHCYAAGHNRNGCDILKKFIEENPDSYQAVVERQKKERRKANPRKCSYCSTPGHTRRRCDRLESDRELVAKALRKSRMKIEETLVAKGLGVGSFVNVNIGWSGLRKNALVSSINWKKLDIDGGHITADFLLLDGSKTSRSFRLDEVGIPDPRVKPNMVLSRVDERSIRLNIPQGWRDGTLCDEDEYFPKGQPRHSWKLQRFEEDEG
jgi:hypothetical protein